MSNVKVFCVVGLGYGDEGKGNCVDFLCRTRDVKHVVKYTGGHQCGHNVVTPEGQAFCFSQLSSGSFVGATTWLGPDFIMEPLALDKEKTAFAKLTGKHIEVISSLQSSVTTPYHKAFNQIRSRLAYAATPGGWQNTCGVGIGATRRSQLDGYGLTVTDFLGDNQEISVAATLALRRKLRIIRDRMEFEIHMLAASFGMSDSFVFIQAKRELWPSFAIDHVAARMQESMYNSVNDVHADSPTSFALGQLPIVMEGGQGYRLDQYRGADGFNTWTDTTTRNAFEWLYSNGYIQNQDIASRRTDRSAIDDGVRVIGCVRWYGTRHGEGPLEDLSHYFNDEDTATLLAAERHNDSLHPYQGQFRVYERYWVKSELRCLRDCQVDSVAISHLDLLPERADAVLRGLLHVPVSLLAYGPTAADRKETKIGLDHISYYED